MAEAENMDPNMLECPPSPPSPEPMKPSRRSSLAAARRLSRASTMAGGVIFDDLLATIPGPDNATCQERLEKLIQLAVSSSVRAAVEDCHDDEDIEDAAKDASMDIRKEQVFCEVSEVVQQLEAGVDVEGENIGGELKKLRDYTEKLNEEGVRWKEMLAERKELYKNTDRNAKLVQTGDIAIQDDVKWTLTGEERLKLTKTAETCKAAVIQMENLSSNSNLEIFLRSISTANVRRDTTIKQNNEKLSNAVKALTERADTIGNKL